MYASVFAAFLPKTPSILFSATLVALVLALVGGWYAVVASLLSARRPREAYSALKSLLDRVAGGVLALLGARLIAVALLRR